MKGKYYLLVGIDKEDIETGFQCIFSDYDKETVQYEKEAEYLSYKKMKIISVKYASDNLINIKINQLNYKAELTEYVKAEAEETIKQCKIEIKKAEKKLKKLTPAQITHNYNNEFSLNKAGDHYSDLWELSEDLKNESCFDNNDRIDIIKLMNIKELKLALIENELNQLLNK